MRFWAFNIMFVCVPTLCFMTYAQFETEKCKVIIKQRDEFLMKAEVSYIHLENNAYSKSTSKNIGKT